MKDGIWAKTAKIDPVIVNQPAEEWMDQNAKSTIKVIFKNH